MTFSFEVYHRLYVVFTIYLLSLFLYLFLFNLLYLFKDLLYCSSSLFYGFIKILIISNLIINFQRSISFLEV